MKIKKRAIIFSLILFVSLISFSSFVSSETLFCAEKTTDNTWCQNVPENKVDKDFRWAPQACQITAFCKVGTCISGDSGTCTQNTPQALCESQGNSWSQEPKDNIQACRPGCCILGQEISFVNQATCKGLASDYGVNVNFRADINTQSACLALDTTPTEGACVLEKAITSGSTPSGFFQNLFGGGSSAPETTLKIDCVRTTQSGCSSLKGNFHTGLLCTAQDPNTGGYLSDCAKDSTKTIIYRDKVYFVDTCGNRANIYDSSRFEGSLVGDYWTKIQTPTCSVGSTPSSTCGDCSYRLGTIGAEYKSGENGMPTKPKYGNNVCRDLGCVYEDEEYKHGESWCAKTPGVYPRIPLNLNEDKKEKEKIARGSDTYNLPGSEYTRLKCYDGEIIPETCGDFARNYVCKEGVDPATEKKSAACYINPAAKCFDNNNAESCEENDLCKWLPGYAPGGLFIGYGLDEVETELGKIYENNAARYNDLQGTCLPLITPGTEFWTADGKNDCKALSITENVLFETGVGTEREEFAKDDVQRASNRCIDNCWAIPWYGSKNDKKYADIETLKAFQLEDGNLDTKVQDGYFSKREGYYCKKKAGEPDIIDNWKGGAEKGNTINCGGGKDSQERRFKQFYTHEQWLDAISERTRSLGDCGYKPHAYNGKKIGGKTFNWTGNPDSEKIIVSFFKLTQKQEEKELIGEKKLLYRGPDIRAGKPISISGLGYRGL